MFDAPPRAAPPRPARYIANAQNNSNRDRAASNSTRARARAAASAPTASSPSSAAPTIGSLGDTTTDARGATSTTRRADLCDHLRRD